LALGSDVLAPADPAEETLRVSMRNPAPEPPPLPDVVVPVPLSDRRQRERGFNQTHLLAAHLALHLNLPLDDTNLVRTKHTEEQAGKTRAERLQSLRGAFAVCAPQRLDGRTVLLVDDVMTTGSTANACARVLRGMDDDRDGGAREVWLAVAARAITEKS
jgi:ComF family protein